MPQRPPDFHTPPSPLLSRAELGESPLWPVLAVVTAAGLYATLPTRFISGHSTTGVFGAVRWLVPALTLLLLVALVFASPRRLDSLVLERGGRRLSRRIAALAVIALISAANGASIILLVHSLIAGEQAQARQLLRVAIHLWCINVLVFALWFWQLDGGGPLARRLSGPRADDFLFPQQTLEASAGTWQPNFIDYLFVSYTNATAFSPTDTMPLSQWAKLLMILQSAASLLLAIMVAARAVNILH
jgi:hypothetical protein